MGKHVKNSSELKKKISKVSKEQEFLNALDDFLKKEGYFDE